MLGGREYDGDVNNIAMKVGEDLTISRWSVGSNAYFARGKYGEAFSYYERASWEST